MPCGDPCDSPLNLPRRLSCCDCINLTKVGCIPTCSSTGQQIPFPHLYICWRYQSSGAPDQLCRRCCAGDPSCGGPNTATSCTACCDNGVNVKSCKGDAGPPEKSDIWAHMRCGPKPDVADQSVCRRCCGDDCQPVIDSCQCCATIQQRFNF